MENILLKYLELVSVCYIIRLLITRIIFEFSSVKKFFYEREILPGVRNWNNRLQMAYYNELFSFIQSLLIVSYFMIFYNFAPIKSHYKIIIIFLLYSSFIIADKVRFSVILTNYPYSLLVVDTAIFLFTSFLQFLAMDYLNSV